MSKAWDVAVVGAGPAGALAAYLLARSGRRVVIVERERFPRAKVCGGCFNPEARAVLARVGLSAVCGAANATAVTRFRVAAWGREASVRLTGWLAVGRAELDAALIAAAMRAGATFLPETAAELGPDAESARTLRLRTAAGDSEIVADMVIAADGLQSRLVAAATAHPALREPGARVGAGVIMECDSADFPTGTIAMATGDGGYVGLVRLADGKLNIAAAFDPDHLRQCGRPGVLAERLLRQVGWPIVPGIADAPWRGTVSLTRQAHEPAAERILAVGDAAGYVEPFTGEGMAWALAAGEAVAQLACDGWREGVAESWSDWIRRTARRRHRMIRAVAWGVRQPRVAGPTIALGHYFPSAASRVISLLFHPRSSAPPRPPTPARIRARRTAAEPVRGATGPE
jgi:flavin-dependent dehydrogenase